jgi:predicted nuclease of predicted toxin-antitoxin system
MRLLIDNALSPTVARGLSAAGYDVVHVRDVGLHHAADASIFDFAAAQGRTLVSADTDFGTLLAARAVAKPSVILFRDTAVRRPESQVEVLLANLAALTDHLEAGSCVSIRGDSLRVRRLPLRG